MILLVWEPEEIDGDVAAVYVGVAEDFQELILGQAAIVAIWELLVALFDLHQGSNLVVDAVLIFKVCYGCFL